MMMEMMMVMMMMIARVKGEGDLPAAALALVEERGEDDVVSETARDLETVLGGGFISSSPSRAC
jgi:hypothetical protein